ncbi:MAG: mannose-1-phosphate guanylyltransferase/mannose-6-phosphate isomerase [Magnetococcales bacterium]|nr:mannose-1-phosphate guanylyltransferase/mannose-6-phosphate isomerase [Magnetococcales bacterium]
MPILPVILSGGSGTRLWPLSRAGHPKQFLALMGEETLFQAAMRRLQGLPDTLSPILVCNEQHRFLAAEQARLLGVVPLAILLEPEGRNTAPAVACAAIHALSRHPDALLLVLPADHLIPDIPAFHRAVGQAVETAREGWLVTFGIVARAPETGFGYIHQGSPLGASGGVFRVHRFVEKPDEATARGFVASGSCFWNSGMFLLRAATYLEELARLAPEILAACRAAMAGSVADLDFLRLDPEAFLRSPGVSIDYAVMEKTGRAAVVPLDAGWSDLGSWSAIWETGERDGDGNTLYGDVILEGMRDSHVRSCSRLVAALGLENVVIVETADAVLVAARERVQEVRTLVARLQREKRQEAILHRKVYRPWGAYERLNEAARFQVKRITVNPGGALSLQKHLFRAEHWVVVKGQARVTRGEEVFLLEEDQSTYIPVGMPHRLENQGATPLELIEVQSGGYLGEDDIVRFEDQYGRAAERTRPMSDALSKRS